MATRKRRKGNSWSNAAELLSGKNIIDADTTIVSNVNPNKSKTCIKTKTVENHVNLRDYSNVNVKGLRYILTYKVHPDSKITATLTKKGRKAIKGQFTTARELLHLLPTFYIDKYGKRRMGVSGNYHCKNLFEYIYISDLDNVKRKVQVSNALTVGDIKEYLSEMDDDSMFTILDEENNISYIDGSDID